MRLLLTLSMIPVLAGVSSFAFSVECSSLDAPKKPDGKVELTAAVMDSHPKTTILLRASNGTKTELKLDHFMINGNGIQVDIPQIKYSHFFATCKEWAPDCEPSVHLVPGATHEWMLEIGRVLDDVKGVKPGMLVFIRWDVVVGKNVYSSNSLVLVQGEDGEPAGATSWCAIPGDKRITVPILAVIHYDNKSPAMGILFRNGGTQPISVVEPLATGSVIVASAPAIGYTRTLVLPEAAAKAVTVEPGKVAEWRLPWKTVLDLIPKEDMAKIKAAGGDLDLIWKVGDLQSDVLPISLGKEDAALKQQGKAYVGATEQPADEER